MISSPCDAGVSDTVADVFGDDLPVAEYGNNWGIFARDEVNQQYRMLTLTDSLAAGDGYWIQAFGTDLSIDVDGVTQPVVMVQLVGDPDSGHYNLVGHPFLFDVCWADVEVIYGSSVLSLDEADPLVESERACSKTSPDASCVASRIGYSWTGSAYSSFDGVTPGAEGTLGPFDGLWVKAFKPGLALRIPTRESASCDS